MLRGIRINERIRFTSKNDTSEPKTVFIMRPMSGFDRLTINMDMNEGRPVTLMILERAIVDIENMDDAFDNKSDFIKSLPIDVVNELFDKINEISNVSVEDKKKS